MNPILSGFDRSLYKYLGHFAKNRFLAQGHNDTPPLPDPTGAGHTVATMNPVFWYQSGRRLGGSVDSPSPSPPPINSNTRLERLK